MPARKQSSPTDLNPFARVGPSGFGEWRERLGVHSVAELRQLADEPASLRKAGIGRGETKTLQSMSALSRVFPANIATILAEHTPGTFADIAGMDNDAFETLLIDNGIAASRAAYQRTRLAALRQRIRNGQIPADLNGLTLDLPGNILSSDDAAKLRAAGVETLEDWPAARATIQIPPRLRDQLNSYAESAAAWRAVSDGRTPAYGRGFRRVPARTVRQQIAQEHRP